MQEPAAVASFPAADRYSSYVLARLGMSYHMVKADAGGLPAVFVCLLLLPAALPQMGGPTAPSQASRRGEWPAMLAMVPEAVDSQQLNTSCYI